MPIDVVVYFFGTAQEAVIGGSLSRPVDLRGLNSQVRSRVRSGPN